MLFCPYCGVEQKPSNKENAFDDIGGFYLTDSQNGQKMMLKNHSHGCGRIFIAIYDTKQAKYTACFKFPQEDWVRALFYRSHI